MDPFISRQDLTDYMGVDVTSDDGAIIAIDAACQIVRDVCGQTLDEVVDDEQVFDGTGTDCLVLPEVPVTEVSTVSIDDGTDLTEVTDWVLGRQGRLLRTSANGAAFWPLGRQNVIVTYSHGWSEVPESVRMVALAVANRIVVQGPAMNESIGGDSVAYAVASTDLTSTERLILRLNAGH